ncbi:hypothetical protein QTP88_010845 [Uroleucon formosanum]
MSSVMWNFFKKVENGGTCKIFSIFIKTCSNMTNLKQHLKKKHPSVNHQILVNLLKRLLLQLNSLKIMKTMLYLFSPCLDQHLNVQYSQFLIVTRSSTSTTQSLQLIQPTIDQLIKLVKSYEAGGAKNVSVTNASIYMIVKDNMPLSFTEKDGFMHFMKIVLPLYKVPSRKTFTTLLSLKYDVLSASVKSKLSLTDTINTKSFLGITGHCLSLCKLKLESISLGVLELDERHTSVNIADWLNDALNTWGINKSQIFLVVTDNGANIKNAVYACFDDTQDVALVIDKVKKKIVTFFKQSVSASDELRKISNFKLKQSVSTRWNSVYFMLDRFITCSDFIASIIVKFPKDPSMLSGSDLFSAKEIMHLLKPFEAVTKELCGQNYVQLPFSIPVLKKFHSTDPITSSKAISIIKKKIVDISSESSETGSNSMDTSDEDDANSLRSVHKEQLVSKKNNK